MAQARTQPVTRTTAASPVTHQTLPCGIELAVLHLPDRRAMAMDIRVAAGAAYDPPDRLGLADLVSETLDKGTAHHTGRELSDAFDAIGAVAGSWCGREQTGFTSLCLPEFFDRTVELHAEYLRTPTFPEDSCSVAIELAHQELLTLEDDPQSLADKFLCRQALGPVLGRHVTGEDETLSRISRADFLDYWQRYYRAGRMIMAVAGPLPPTQVADIIARRFEGFGPPAPEARPLFEVEFAPITTHHQKETEQEQIAMALRSIPLTHPDQPVERVLLGVLSGGMSARLFSEVREKQGLVYWVSAWRETPRGSGMLFVGASTTPARVDQTYTTLLRELERAAEDVTAAEIERALAGIMVRADIRGDVTRAQCGELADDIVHYGRYVPREEKIARVQKVTPADVARYAAAHLRRQPRSTVTLGPRPLVESGS
jgi:predicted Zn-dependent peptidase